MQGEGEDWKEESKRMEDVYTSAHCTIAATRAVYIIEKKPEDQAVSADV
jgi:hypothetical protein